MIERYYDQYTPVCDYCNEAVLPGEMRFDDAARAMRDAGWKTRKEAGVWQNYCPECWQEVEQEEKSKAADA